LLFWLIPAVPLDGGRVLRSILWGATGSLRRATYWAALAGQQFAWILIAWGVFQFFGGNWLGGIWSGLIGMFLNNAAQGSYQQVLVRQTLHGEPVRRFMNRDPITVPPSLDLHHWVDDFVYRFHRKSYPVVADGHLEGFIDTQRLANLARSEWDAHTIGEVMRRDLSAMTIGPDADALDALGQMQRGGVTCLLVVDQGRLVGIVSLKDLLKFLNLKLQLEGPGDDGGAAVLGDDFDGAAHHAN
jgi:CBS domain-containing protein